MVPITFIIFASLAIDVTPYGNYGALAVVIGQITCDDFGQEEIFVLMAIFDMLYAEHGVGYQLMPLIFVMRVTR